MFHTETKQALRAMTILAGRREVMSLADLAQRSASPAPALARVLARLGRRGLVTGRRGPGGGYLLARPAGEIPLRDIVLPIEGARFGRGCLFGRSRCSAVRPCPLHGTWAVARSGILELLAQRSLADLVADGRRGRR
ncbi:MAG: RrF2 family transcriptional regulator [Acidobacteriota bacterium]